jgi:DNA-binding LytR/AlgR family response regulator
LLDRLPPGFGERIRCLEMEDHYVRVHGEHRSDLLLMRMADAIRETAPLPGLQVHRSWWVSLDAVAAQERDGRRTMLLLDNGKRVPVAASRVPAVRAALASADK